jgi:NAD(P)-dependent dehydrogenase (short-subunit alcohol dehydrogenase family)
MGDFEARVVLVTGGSEGIGQAIAERFARAGALVAITHHPDHADDGAAVVGGIEARGGKAFAIPAFLGPAGTAEALARAVLAELRQRTSEEALDVLVNNVGGGGYGRLADTTNEFFDAVVGRNVRVPYFLVQSLLPHLRRGGSVINISSAAARLVNPDLEVYSLAKASQNKFTQVLAREIGPLGIRVNAIMPGFIDTAINQPFLSDPANLKSVLDNTALGRLGRTEDIADVAHALASDAFGFVTGQIIEVGGGFDTTTPCPALPGG